MHRCHFSNASSSCREVWRSAALAALFWVPAACGPQDAADRDAAEDAVSPTLAVVLVVDQLTPSLLERYDDAFEGGLRRLLDGGYHFPDAVHDHAVTFTSPGHASPVTGVMPARHGVVSNSWREWREGDWRTVSSVADPETELVGGSGTGSSPRNLQADGLADWILGHDPGSRVVSLSGKNTASVLMGPRSTAGLAEGGPDDRRHVYWFSVGSEGFVTSTYYRGELPGWVEEFNASLLERFGGNGCWVSELPAEVAALSRPDTVPYEADGVHTHFPHCADQEPYSGLAHFISRTPKLDEATLALAQVAVRELELGRRGSPDYLAVPLSATDRVGHEFGPYSREQLDNLVRLDRALGEFLGFLDSSVGRGRYVVAVTADHGVLPLPEYLAERGRHGRRLTSELGDLLTQASAEVGPTGAELEGEEVAARREELASRLEEVEWVEAVYPLEVLQSEAPADSLVRLYRNSFHPERLTTQVARYGVQVLLTEGTLSRSTGTTHGVPYLHDRRVPLLFYGEGVSAGSASERARTVDLAPTVAALLGVPAPEGLDGRVLHSITPGLEPLGRSPEP